MKGKILSTAVAVFRDERVNAVLYCTRPGVTAADRPLKLYCTSPGVERPLIFYCIVQIQGAMHSSTVFSILSVCLSLCVYWLCVFLSFYYSYEFFID